MSIYKPEELRYIKLDSVKQERALFRNYWNDVINQYGIDVEYYRRRTDYVTPNESSAMLYGHNNVAVYDKKSNIRVKVDYNAYDFILSDQGFTPSDNLTLYFGINDFATSFVDEIGQFKEYGITSEKSGTTTIKNGCIRIPFTTDVYSGTAVVQIEKGTVKENYEIEDIEDSTKKCLSVAYNPYIYRSFATDYKDGYFSLNMYCDYDATKGNKVSYTLRGGVLYSDFFQDEKIIDKIHPNVGDVIEINYHTNDMDVEQYEITELISRKPTAQDGISPFLGKCVYKCTAVRRISSHEETIPTTDGVKKASDNHRDFEKKRADAIEDTYNWEDGEKKNDSKYYGGYGKSEVFKDSRFGALTGSVDQIFDYDQWKMDWPDCTLTDGNYNICTFSDNSSLYTDGINLVWKFEDGTTQSLTNIPPSSVKKIDGEIPEMMYVRAENGQIVFYTADMNTSVQLTHFTNPQMDDFQYFENFAYKDIGYVNNEGFYIFKNNRIAFNSFGNEAISAFDGKTRQSYEIARRN